MAGHARVLLAMVIGCTIGVAAVVFGGYDDSPGLQGLGLLLALGTVWFGVRNIRRNQ